ncbi:MAG TPA: 16S rRNA (adenine(1518)-N(6)/adenine(1519)-N(6))-dimethyltransferase RsmA [Gammaproteobacteria bacterium]|nr:16S rRNA (adenine(1518)-N(6)/adenine(1519)-N(6))-dimethyltransferase RsmA [Gammaproteobacteria bacterium]
MKPRVRAKKRLGQHFLHDPAVLRRLVGAIAPAPGDRMVEIGPGPGALTRLLLEKLERLDAIEIDRELAATLPLRVEHPERLVVHATDALEFDFGTLAAGPRSLRVVGNLPYNISTPLLFRLLGFGPLIKDLHVMLQREVVARMTAEPGGKEYGRLTVMLAAAADCEACFDVGPGAFTPPPKVWSTVVRITPRAPAFSIADPSRFAALVAHLFSMRRKTLARSLKGRATAAQIASLDIDPTARPETLSPAEFAKLAALDAEP